MKKAMGMFAALVIALGMSGLAYASWSETLTISGTVNTGTVDVAWSEIGTSDSEPPDKDVSGIDCEIDAVNPNLLHVTVTNAYPCIDYYNIVDIHCVGSIPVHIYDIIVNNPHPNHVEVDISYYADPGCTIEIIDLPIQLHTCDTIFALIHVHLTQDALQNHTYGFSAQIVAIQWNEP